MLASRQYLQYELARIEQVLNETLRYRYASFEFFEECDTRLQSLRRTVDEAASGDEKNFNDIAWNVEDLSMLITDIERAHAEEFAWPFAQALKRMLTAVSKSLFFFRAEGGTSSYWVQPDAVEKNFSQRITSVVFPRALKDSVLLHAVLGHELGHAVVLEHLGQCVTLMENLIEKTVLEDADALFDWCKQHFNVKTKYSTEYVATQSRSWVEEFFCDIFGLVTMGPAYIHAWTSLLEVRSYNQEDEFVPTHPPFFSRLESLHHAARALGMVYSDNPATTGFGTLSVNCDRIFVERAENLTQTQYALLPAKNVENVAIALQRFTRQHHGLTFPEPDSGVIAQLVEALRAGIPPAGPFPAAYDSNGRFALSEKSDIDFRHIMFAGWIVGLENTGDMKHFQLINSLCSFAIMQQEGVKYWNARVNDESTSVP